MVVQWYYKVNKGVGNMKDWSLMVTPEGEYVLFLNEVVTDLDKNNSMCFTVSKGEAERIIEKTGCVVEILPF